MCHTHTKYAWRPIDGTGATMEKGILQDKYVFDAWTKNIRRGQGLKATFSTSFGLLHGIVLRTTEHINIRYLIGKFQSLARPKAIDS